MVEMPKPINITVKFHPAMEAITGYSEMPTVMSDGATFLFLLDSVFISYPELKRRYPPGKLGMSLNSLPPKESDVLCDGDEVAFFII
jgi:hypothetical protein